MIEKYEAQMRREGVSVVARSKSGFLTAYRKADGDSKKLSDQWFAKRNAFIKRHMAQAIKNREQLGDMQKPSRRHLALIAWAYSPGRFA